MELPEGVKVSDSTLHMIKSLRSKQEMREMLMSGADLCQSISEQVKELADNLLKSAAEPENYRHFSEASVRSLLVMEIAKAVHGVAYEAHALHQLLHNHEDDVRAFGEFLDREAVTIAYDVANAHIMRDEASDGVAHATSMLALLARGVL